MTEIFHLAKSEIKKFDNDGKLNFGVVITGGGSKLENIEDLALEVFELEIKKGKPNSINGIDDIINNPRYATTIGLIQYAATNEPITIDDPDDESDLIQLFKKSITKVMKLINLK